MDPHSAHMIGFALDVSHDEVVRLIEIADEQEEASLSYRLARNRDALARIREDFSTQSDNLQELADQTEAIASDISEVEVLLDIFPDDAAFHGILAAGYLNTEAKSARGE